MNPTKFRIPARLLLVLLTVKAFRAQNEENEMKFEENEVKATTFEDKATLGARTNFIFYDKK